MEEVLNKPAKDVYTTRETADLLGVSLRTVQLWVENGVLKAWKTAGGHRRISRDSIEMLLRERSGALDYEQPEKQYKLLIIEDDQDLLDLYSLQIKLWDMPLQVLTAVNGYEGLMKIGEQLPDIVIVDLILPNMNGFELIKNLQSSQHNKHTEIIVVSSLSEEEIKNRGGLSKDIIRLAKPVSFEILHKLIAEKISNKRSNKRKI